MGTTRSQSAMRASQKQPLLLLSVFLNTYVCLLDSKMRPKLFNGRGTWYAKTFLLFFVYLDDIVIASSSTEEHCTHLRTLFQWLANNSLLLNPNKCEFGCTEIGFLGYRISPDGIKPNPIKVTAIHNLPRPQTKGTLAIRRNDEFLSPLHPTSSGVDEAYLRHHVQRQQNAFLDN